MQHRILILALDVGTVMFFVFAAISFVSWIVNQANAANAAKKAPPRQPNPQAAPQRNPQVQREIERFLRDAAAKQRGTIVEADEIEVVRPATARRPPPKRKVVEKPRPTAIPRISAPLTTSQSALPSAGRPGEQFAAHHLAPAPKSAVASEHLQQSKAAAQFPNDVSKSVSAHLGVFSAGARPGEQRRRTASSFAAQLRTPHGMRSAIVLQEILKRPRALRAIQRKPAG